MLYNERKNNVLDETLTEQSKDSQNLSPETSTEPPSIQKIAERYLSEVEWLDGLKGRCKCPGQHKHTAKSHRNDCWVFINGTPTVSCLHASCTEEIKRANDSIRSAWSLFQPPLDEVSVAAAKEKAAKRYALEAKAAVSKIEILKQYRWDVEDIERETCGPQLYPKDATNVFLSTLFQPEDILWIGEPADSGFEKHRWNFLPCKDWVDRLPTEYHYTCASTFKPGTYSRANVNVQSTPYLIVEGDKVLGYDVITEQHRMDNKNACGAIFNWLRTSVGLELRAVVDSGNKSLHGWFVMPSAEKFQELKVVLPAMGCDRAMFKPTQPARLPGVKRDNGNEQKLLWVK